MSIHWIFYQAFFRNDPVANMVIDDIPRCIRYYGTEATILDEDHRTVDLSFMVEPGNDTRIIDIDGMKITVPVVGNYTDFSVDNNEIHQIKLGAPTRELFIDGNWYPLGFGDSMDIHIGSRVRKVTLEGEPPKVRIGEIVREDLCLGNFT